MLERVEASYRAYLAAPELGGTSLYRTASELAYALLTPHTGSLNRRKLIHCSVLSALRSEIQAADSSSPFALRFMAKWRREVSRLLERESAAMYPIDHPPRWIN